MMMKMMSLSLKRKIEIERLRGRVSSTKNKAFARTVPLCQLRGQGRFVRRGGFLDRLLDRHRLLHRGRLLDRLRLLRRRRLLRRGRLLGDLQTKTSSASSRDRQQNIFNNKKTHVSLDRSGRSRSGFLHDSVDGDSHCCCGVACVKCEDFLLGDKAREEKRETGRETQNKRSIQNDTSLLSFFSSAFGCQKDTKKLHREIFFFFFFSFFFPSRAKKMHRQKSKKMPKEKRGLSKKKKRKRERRGPQLFDHHRPPPSSFLKKKRLDKNRTAEKKNCDKREEEEEEEEEGLCISNAKVRV